MVACEKTSVEEVVEDKLESGLRSSANDGAMCRILDPDRLAWSWNVLSQPTDKQVSLLPGPGHRLHEHGLSRVQREQGTFSCLCGTTQGMAQLGRGINSTGAKMGQRCFKRPRHSKVSAVRAVDENRIPTWISLTAGRGCIADGAGEDHGGAAYVKLRGRQMHSICLPLLRGNL